MKPSLAGFFRNTVVCLAQLALAAGAVLGCTLERPSVTEVPRVPLAPKLLASPQPGAVASSESTTFAVSLAELQRALERGDPTAASLGGLNQITALVSRDKDVILLGRSKRSVPLLHSDDLAVSARSAHARRGYDGDIGVSIDPDPSASDPWSVHVTSIYGMPRTTRMASLFIFADYYLKRKGAGYPDAAQYFPGVLGSFERVLKPLRESCPNVLPQPDVHRFEFVSAKQKHRFQRCGDNLIRILHPMQVVLTASRKAHPRNIGDSAEIVPAPAARDFALEITAALAGAPPAEYAALVADVRLLEVAYLLRWLGAQTDYLLDRYVLGVFDVPERVPGVHRSVSGTCEPQLVGQSVEGDRVVQHFSQTQWEFVYRGGVRMRTTDLLVEASDFETATACRQCDALERRVFASRPTDKPFVWVVDGGEG